MVVDGIAITKISTPLSRMSCVIVRNGLCHCRECLASLAVSVVDAIAQTPPLPPDPFISIVSSDRRKSGGKWGKRKPMKNR